MNFEKDTVLGKVDEAVNNNFGPGFFYDNLHDIGKANVEYNTMKSCKKYMLICEDFNYDDLIKDYKLYEYSFNRFNDNIKKSAEIWYKIMLLN